MEIGKDHWELIIVIELHTQLEPLFWPSNKQAALVRSKPQNTETVPPQIGKGESAM